MAEKKTRIETWHIQEDVSWVRRDEWITRDELERFAKRMEMEDWLAKNSSGIWPKRAAKRRPSRT